MSDNRELYDPVDRFSEHFRQHLKTYPVSPDENCWDEIEARLQKKRGLSSLWTGLSIAASILVAVFVFSRFLNEKDQNVKESTAYHKACPVEHLVAEAENPDEKKLAMNKKDTTAIDTYIIQDQRILSAGKRAGKQMPAFVDETGMEPDVDDEGDKTIQEASVITNEEQQDAKEEQEQDEEQGAGPEKPYRTFENITAYNMPDRNERNKNKGWQISAGLSSVGGFSSFGVLVDEPMANDPDYILNSPSLGDGDYFMNGSHGEGSGKFSKERITDVKPAIPFSVGMMVRKKLNRTLGLETGLVYTRLSSDIIIENNTYTYDAVLNLHYLGVPVNLTVNMWEKNRVSLYASGGGMVEKGLRYVFKQKTPVWNNLMKKEETDYISGLQWSLNGGIGVSYNFYRDMNLYIEPGLSYYFDCNQPVSKRTEDPLSFSLKVGVRYDF